MKYTQEKLSKSALALILAGVMLLTGITGCNTSWLDTAIQDLPVLIQIAANIVAIIGAANGGQIDPNSQQAVITIGNEVKNDLQLVKSLVTDYQAATDQATKNKILGEINAALSTVQSNLSGLLTAAHIKDPRLQNTVATIVSIALTTVLAIQTLLPATSTSARRAAKQTKPPSPTDLRKQYNSVIDQNGLAPAYRI